jgi:hypothetical protein
MSTHTDLLDASRAIGGIFECAEWYTEALAGLIVLSGKRVQDLTVRELIELIELAEAAHARREGE